MRAQDCHHPERYYQGKFRQGSPEGGVLARRTNGISISLHRHVSETALVQMMRCSARSTSHSK